MRQRRLLYLDSRQLTAFFWRPGRLHEEGRFTSTAEGYDAFAAYLASHPDCIFSVLVNVDSEEFRRETIPYLHGRDRQAVIDRKIAHAFLSARLTASFSLGHRRDRRKDEQVLLMALTDNEFFAPWLDCIEQTEIALRGIYPLPVLVPGLLGRRLLGERPCLVLTAQDHSLRQSFFDQGELVFSRLVLLKDRSIDTLAHGLSAETQKLHQYLSGKHLIDRDQILVAHILAHSSAFDGIRQRCIDGASIRYNLLALEALAAKSGLVQPPVDSSCAALFLNRLASAPPPTQLADAALRHAFLLGRCRASLNATGWLALSASLAFSAHNLWQADAYTRQAEALHQAAEHTRARYESIVLTFPELPISHEHLRRLVERHTAIERLAASPIPLYREISRALVAAPAVEIDRIDWKTGPLPASFEGRTPPTPAAPALGGADEGESAQIQGTIRLTHNATPRRRMNAFNRFVETLAANPSLSIEVSRRPIDGEPGTRTHGDDTPDNGESPDAFALSIARKIGS